MDSKNFAVGVLSTTAVILLVGLVIIHTRSEPVRADGMVVSGGDYLLTVGALDERDEEFVYLIDTPAEKMIIYRFDAVRKQIEVVQGIDLEEMRAVAEPDTTGTKARSPRYRRP